MRSECDVAVIGAGPAGLAAAIEARKAGAARVVILERNSEPGGILPQCIHNGFGSEIFKRDLPGPSYARRFIEQAHDAGVEILCDTAVLDMTPGRMLFAISPRHGYLEISARAVVIATGCRERTRAQIRLPGDRPAGVFTAGLVQRLVNIEGFMPGKRFVILGSGDIGMIMARRLTYEGAQVDRVVEMLPYLTGLRRNYVQCLADYDIPLHLSTTVNRIIGKNRVEAVETVRVGADSTPIAGTEETAPCDTLLLSVGLIPENELSRKAGIPIDPLTGGPYVLPGGSTLSPGFFAAGNSVAIYDLADHVSSAGMDAGRSAALFAASGMKPEAATADLLPGENVRTVLPQKIAVLADRPAEIILQLRVSRVFNKKIALELLWGESVVAEWKVPYARPAEMLTVKLKPGQIGELPGILDTPFRLRAVSLEGE